MQVKTAGFERVGVSHETKDTNRPTSTRTLINDLKLITRIGGKLNLAGKNGGLLVKGQRRDIYIFSTRGLQNTDQYSGHSALMG